MQISIEHSHQINGFPQNFPYLIIFFAFGKNCNFALFSSCLSIRINKKVFAVAYVHVHCTCTRMHAYAHILTGIEVMHVCRSPMLEAEEDEPQDMQLDGINNYNRKGKSQSLQKFIKIVQI